MGHPQIAAFARLADGSPQAPARTIGGEASLLTRGTHDIRYDEVHDEIVVAMPQSDAVLVFRGGAIGEEPPIRVIQGSNTRIRSDRLDIDPVHGEIFVPTRDSVIVFDREANGNVAPIRVIEGPDTLLDWGSASTLAVDPVNNVIAVGTFNRVPERMQSSAKILFFNRTDSGNVAPIGVIDIPYLPRPAFAGTPRQGMDGGQAIDQMQMYPPKGLVIATLPAGDRSWEAEEAGMEPFDPYIGVWSIHDRGAVPPLFKLAGDQTTLLRPRGVALVPEHGEILVADMRQNALLTFFFPEIFD